jgi:DNA polymerase I
MDYEILPTVTLRSRSFNALATPRELFILALNRNLNLQRFRVLYVAGNSSAILSRKDRRFEVLDIRRGFTVYQLMTILEEAHHSLILIEHDPHLYDDAQEMTEYIYHALSDAAKEAAVLLYAQGIDPFFENLVQNADRVFYFEEGPREKPRLAAKSHQRARENQTTQEAYS